MGLEVSTYINAVVQELQAAYGEAWNIAARGELPYVQKDGIPPVGTLVSRCPWAVQVGYSRFVPHYRGDLGMDLEMTCCATVSYTGVGPGHNSGLQQADIALTLAAWLSGHVVEGTLAKDVEVDIEPFTAVRGGVEVPTGQYLAHVFWDARLDDIDPDIDIEGYTTLHPSRPLADRYYWEIERTGGVKTVVLGDADTAPPLPPDGVAARKIIFADPLNVPPATHDTVYYPALLEVE